MDGTQWSLEAYRRVFGASSGSEVGGSDHAETIKKNGILAGFARVPFFFIGVSGETAYKIKALRQIY